MFKKIIVEGVSWVHQHNSKTSLYSIDDMKRHGLKNHIKVKAIISFFLSEACCLL